MKTFKKAFVLFTLLICLSVSGWKSYTPPQTEQTVYSNAFASQADIDTLSIPNISLQGEYEWDTSHNLIGEQSLRMTTNPSLQPYYFYLFASRPYTDTPIKIEVTAALSANTESFGIGWQVYRDGQLAIMFARLNYTSGNIEILETTAPHIWQTVAPIPFNVRRDNVLQPFRMWLSIDPETMTYTEFGFHAYCLINGTTNRWVYPLSTAAVPTTTENTDALMIKINPQGKFNASATVWLGEIEMSEIP